MLDRRVNTFSEAIAGLRDGATVLLGGFGGAGVPLNLIMAVYESGVKDLTVITNNGGGVGNDLSILLRERRVAKLICSYPKSKTNKVFLEIYRAGKVQLEVVPQGTLVERIRCGGAGLGGFYTPVAAGTELAKGKETRVMNGREYVLELPLHADFALLRGKKADRMGNLTYNKTARNFAPVMATAADIVVAEVEEIVEVGAIDPETVVTPGIFVNRIVKMGAPA